MGGTDGMGLTDESARPHPGKARADVGVSEREVEAAKQAAKVVGLYGDPDVTWGISLEVVLEQPCELDDARARLEMLFAEYPHLGPVPLPEPVPVEAWDRRREVSACAPFGPEGLVRVLVRSDGRAVFVTAHHGVVDGFGLVALTSALLDRDLCPRAKGVGDRRPRRSFLVSSALRVGEALVSPPARFSGTPSQQPEGTPEILVQRSGIPGRLNGAVLCAAVLAVHRAWPRDRTSQGRRFLAVMGASRRGQGEYAPDRDTAYLRIPLRHGWDSERVARAIREAEPEPDFPETRAGGIGPWVVRRLKERLGYTANISNMGLFAGEGIESMAIYPAVNGPRAVGVGLVTAAGGATISVRVRRSDFSEEEAQRLLQEVVDRVVSR